MTLADLLLRRVRLGLLLPNAGLDELPKIRAIAQPELGWDDAKWEREVKAYRDDVEEGLLVADVSGHPHDTNDTNARHIARASLCLGGLACSNRKSEIAPSSSSHAASDATTAAPERGIIECLSIEAPAGSTKAAGVGGGLAFHGAKQLRSGTVSYDPSFTVTTQAAEGANLNAVRDELMASFTKDYSAVLRTASRTGGIQVSDLQPPRVTPSPVAGLPGHAWQIDSIASFNGERLPWRAYSMIDGLPRSRLRRDRGRSALERRRAQADRRPLLRVDSLRRLQVSRRRARWPPAPCRPVARIAQRDAGGSERARCVDASIGLQRFVDALERHEGRHGHAVRFADEPDHLAVRRRLAIAHDHRDDRAEERARTSCARSST